MAGVRKGVQTPDARLTPEKHQKHDQIGMQHETAQTAELSTPQ